MTMNLKSVSNSVLLSDTKRFALEERRNGMEVLYRLREIDARKLFASLGYSSLFEYTVKELGFSEGSASRRLQSMRLIREIPEYEEKLKDGLVNEGNLSKAQTFFNQEKKNGNEYSKEEKLDLLGQIEGKSSRQTDQLFASISPESAREEKTRPVNEKETEIRFTADQALMEKLEKLRNLLGHKLGDQKYSSLIEELADLALKKLEPKPTPALGLEKAVSETRYIPAKVKRAVWTRDQGRCTDIGPEGKRCESKYALQYEHVLPFGKGGKSTIENLKLLCPGHQLAAIQAYGLSKMQEFWAK
jgi:hypothetical protein